MIITIIAITTSNKIIIVIVIISHMVMLTFLASAIATAFVQ